jgi:uncharacterized SAM-binding protein YcdF (DUF218 family)
MAWLSHYLQPWILPPGLNILLLSIGIMLYAISARTVGTLIGIAGLISLWLFSAPITAYKMIGFLQDQYPLLSTQSVDSLPAADAIVVLGGGDTKDAEYGDKYRVSDFTMHRVDYAAYLHKKTNLPVIVSGGKIHGAQESTAELMDTYLQDRYQLKATLKEDQSLTTADESRLLAPLLKANRFATVYLVTNAWHMPRSVFTFRQAGINVIPAPMGYYLYGPDYTLLSFFPNKEALYASALAIHEYIGLAWYFIKHP